eukprot:12708960-Alexandrium_andersonii.AAC.1
MGPKSWPASPPAAAGPRCPARRAAWETQTLALPCRWCLAAPRHVSASAVAWGWSWRSVASWRDWECHPPAHCPSASRRPCCRSPGRPTRSQARCRCCSHRRCCCHRRCQGRSRCCCR